MPEGGAFAPACGCRAPLSASAKRSGPRCPDMRGANKVSSGPIAAVDTEGGECRFSPSIVFVARPHSAHMSDWCCA
jgi:hypothetical protein